MKIISITPDIDSGGAAKSLFILAKALAEKGHTLRIMSIAKASRTKKKVEELQAMGVEVRFFNIPYFPIELIVCPIPFWKNLWRSILRVGEFKRLAAEAKAFDPALIHYNSYTTLHLSLLLSRYKSVLHAREVLVEPAWTNALVKPLMKSGIDEVIAISPEEGEQAKRLFSLSVTTIFNSPSHPPCFKPLPQEGNLVFGVFSHITPIKGQLELVRACVLAADGLRKAGAEVRVFGGAVPIHQEYYNKILEEIRLNSLEDVVVFKGFTDQPEEEMARCHLIVRPDATGQPWGRDVIESMSMGRPVLAAGYSRTFIKPGQNGMLVPPKDVKALAEALKELANRDMLAELGLNAFEFAMKNFNPKINIGRTVDCIENVGRIHG